MEFSTFLAAMVRIPAQIIRTGREIVYRLLAWNPWQHVSSAYSINSRRRCVAEDATLKPESGCSGPVFTPNRTACNRVPHKKQHNPKHSPDLRSVCRSRYHSTFQPKAQILHPNPDERFNRHQPKVRAV